MIDFARLQAAVKERLEEDLSIQVTDAQGETLEAAISEASTLLNIPIKSLEYETLERHTTFLGVGRNLCKIRAWERPDIKKKKEKQAVSEAENLFGDYEELAIEQDKDGEVFVQARHDGLYLKVTYPVGDGSKATEEDALALLESREPTSINKPFVTQAVKKAEGEYILVAEYKHIMLNDSSVEVEIADQEMKAFIKVRAPGHGGANLSFEDYISALNNNGVTYGIDEKFLASFADKPVFGEQVCAAKGKKAVDGINTYIEYYFETDQSKVRLKEKSDGKVDFKELNIIQNVFEGEKLARVIPSTRGELGFTVCGKSLDTKDGKDIPVMLGKNVHFAEDGVTILSDQNGQVVMLNNKINVESVYTVDGSVNLKTGNITFLGNVVVTGNIEEGFSVKASGNVEVYGTVDRASIDAEGDVIVRAGITGKDGTVVSAGRSIWAKFIENATLNSGCMVVVSDGIINSVVDAAKRIICEGKRAAIIGGRLRAGEAIRAKSLGSPSGNTETICEVGTDPKSKAELETLMKKRAVLEVDFDEVQLNFNTLQSIKQQRGKLPPEKEEYFNEVVEKRKTLAREVAATNDRIERINTELQEITTVGHVSASVKVHTGVVIIIRDVKEVVRNEYKAITFLLENNIVRAEKYIETQVDTSKKEK
ncbi:MAG: FapA family protein [Termitinemataceae bacterium]|nr:MAG: FapA family protein [Termitinemataceae bacterium]